MKGPAREWTTVEGDLNAVAGHGGSASVTVYGDVTINKAPAEKGFSWARPWDFSGYISEKRRDFVGRAWLFDEVRAWYEDGDGAQALLVCADFGVGKSAFMAELTCEQHGLQIAAYHFCHHDTIETQNPATFVRSIAVQLAAALPAYRSAVEADPDACRWLEDVLLDPASAFERAVIGPLNSIEQPSAPKVLLVDALDEALDFEATAGTGRPTTIVRLLVTRAGRLPPWLRIIATSRRRQDVLQPLHSAFRCATLDGEDARNLDDIHRYVAGRCATEKLASILDIGNRSATEIAALLSSTRQSGGKFLYAVRALHDLESGALPLNLVDNLPPGMDGFYLDAFGRRFPEHEDYAPIGALLAVLSVEREPMSRKELASILCTSENEVWKLLKQLEDFLRVSEKRYALDHLSLAHWLSEENDDGFPRAGRFSVGLKIAEEQIISWARRESSADRAHESAYLVRHLSEHLGTPERAIHFARLLLDFRWLDARLQAVGVHRLLIDFQDVNELVALNALERALRHSAHILGHNDSDWAGADLLASQILGRLQRRAEPEIQILCAQAAADLARDAGLQPLTDSLSSSEALLHTLGGHAFWVKALAVLDDGRLASGSLDRTIKLWNLENGACEMTLKGHTDGVFALALLADGRLASGSRDCTIRLWNPASGKCEATLTGHRGTVDTLALLVDGRLASGAEDHTIRLWNSTSGKCEATLAGHTGNVSALAVLTDGRLASGSADYTIRLWNLVSGVCEATLEVSDEISALVVLSDGRLASGSEHGTIRIWNLSTGSWEMKIFSEDVSALTVLTDGRLATGSKDKTITLWNPTSGKCEEKLADHSGEISSLAALADGRLASGAHDKTIRLWNPSNGVSGTPVDGPQGIFAIVALPDGRFVADSGARESIRLWNATSGECEATLGGTMRWTSALAVLADGRLAAGSVTGTIEIWDLARGVCEATLHAHLDPVSALAVLADGRLASGSWDKTIRLWNPSSGVCEATFNGHTAEVRGLAVLADGRLASGALDRTIALWNPASGTCEATLGGRIAPVGALTVLPDGRLAAASGDTIQIWNHASGECEVTLDGHTDLVLALAVLGDGKLASSSCDRTIRIWQFYNGRWRGAVEFVADAAIFALAFSACAGVLAAGDNSGHIHFLKVKPVPK